MANKITLLIAQYRLPFPLYYSGADKSTIELAQALSSMKHHVHLLFCTGFYTEIDIEKKLKRESLSYTKQKEGFVIDFQGLSIHLFFHDAFFQAYHDFLKKHHDSFILHHTNLYVTKESTAYRYKEWTSLFKTNHRHIAFLRSMEAFSLLSPFKEKLCCIFANSPFMQTQIKHQWSLPSTIMRPVPHHSCKMKEKANFSDYF